MTIYECIAIAASDELSGDPTAESGELTLAELKHERRLEHLRRRREQHERELAAGSPTFAELTDGQLLEAFPGGELEPTEIDLAAQVIACALAGHEVVLGRWWPSMPIRCGLAVCGIADETVIEEALALLAVQVQKHGATGARWRLGRVPELRRPTRERIAECGCRQRPREWRLPGGAWTCFTCHPPAEGLEFAYRANAADRP